MGFISDLLSRKDIDAQGQDLARRFAKRVPKDKTGDAKRVAAEYELLVGDAVSYQRRANLGLVGKSRLVNSFRWTLAGDGYSEDFVKEVSGQLAVTLASS